MIKVDHFSKAFKGKKKIVQAIDDISFEAKPGEIFGLIGPNGAGKTTTLRTIATLLRPDTGAVHVNGFDVVTESRNVRDLIGFLTSDMKLSGNLSPREQIMFFGELNHMEKGEILERIEELNGYLDMKEFLDKPIAKLSTGMKQKASIAVSIVHDPEVIVFDEPTAGLDIIAAKIVTDFLKDSRAGGKTVLLSTHYMAFAEKICDSVGILSEGKLLECGRMGDLLGPSGHLEDLFFDLIDQREAQTC